MATTRDARFPEPTTEGEADFRGHRTWYRITGQLDPEAEQAPLVVLHGGPGAAHNYTLMMANLAGRGRTVIHYDQLGCGGSTHLPEAPADFWTPQLFVDELRNLVQALGIDRRFHLLGQSWGGMLGPEVVLADDSGILSLSICDSPASMELWLKAANTLRGELPGDVQQTLLEHEEAGTTDSQEYAEAEKVFYDRHVCRVVPNPPEVTDSFAQIEQEPTVYHTMNGPSEFHVVGSLKDWSIIERLDGIRVPTLVVAGAHDEAMPLVWEPFLERIADVRSHVFPESSHMPHVEEPDAFLDVVESFLSQHD
jgi:L-proline amide hydrolase